MNMDYLKYRHGYSIGVGGVVLHDNRVLLVRRAMNPRKGDWALPGGYVEINETTHNAVQREVLEESSIHADVIGVMGILHRWVEDENGIYLMFLMQATSFDPQPDMVEVDDTRFFSLEELDDLPKLQWLSRSIVTPILQGKQTVLNTFSLPNDTSYQNGVLYAGHLFKVDKA